MTPNEIEQTMRELEEEMLAAAEELRFEYAAKLRDEIRDLRHGAGSPDRFATSGRDCPRSRQPSRPRATERSCEPRRR
jgi:hypothetical protein